MTDSIDRLTYELENTTYRLNILVNQWQDLLVDESTTNQIDEQQIKQEIVALCDMLKSIAT